MRNLILLLCVVLAGCMSSDVHTFGKIDPSDKSITVPVGASPLLGEIKTALSRDGWRMVVDQGPRTTTGSLTPAVHLETADTFRTRYRLQLSERQYDLCIIPGGAAVVYNLSLIDNSTGAEVIAMGGRDCAPTAASKFESALGAGH